MEKERLMQQENTGLAGYIRKTFALSETDVRTYSPLTLAFIGDAVFDLVIRTCVVECGNVRLISFIRSLLLVQATAQAEHI